MVRRLKAYITDNGLKKSFVAGKLGITNVYLSYILNGQRNPSIDLEDRIRKMIA